MNQKKTIHTSRTIMFSELASVMPLPIVKETDERVTVIVKKQFVSKEVVRLMDKASTEFSLKQKELISLGLLAQQQSYTAVEISSILNQNEEAGLRNWLGRLVELELIIKTGKGKGIMVGKKFDHIKCSLDESKRN